MPAVSAYATVTPSSGTAHYSEATVSLDTSGGVDWQADATVTPDDTPYNIVSGVSSAAQFAMEVWVDGTQVSPANLRGAVSVDRSIDQHTQSGRFQAVHNSLAGTTVFQRLAPQTCADDVDFYGVYRKDGSTYRYKLLDSGVTDSVQIEVNGSEAVDSYGVVDNGGRLSRQLVTLILPAGHNLYRERVARKVLGEAGETSFAFSRGNIRANKAVQLVDANPADFCAEYLSTEHRGLLFSRSGAWVNPLRRSEASSTITFTPASMLSPTSIQLVVPGDVITEAELTGTEQIIGEEEDTCGHETTVQTVSIEAVYAPLVTKYTQNSTTGALTDHGVTQGSATLQETRLVIVTRVTYCNVVLEETTEVYGHYNPEHARYEVDGGVKDYLAGTWYLDATATVDGDERGYTYRAEKWLLISRERIRHYYDKVPVVSTPTGDVLDQTLYYGGVQADASGATYPDERGRHYEAPGGGLTSKTELEGSKLGSIRTLERHYNLRSAIKTRASTSTTWESTALTEGTYLTGAGEGAVAAQESFIETEKDFELLFPNATGTIKRRKLYRDMHVARPGNLKLYGDGTESRDGQQQFTTGYTEETIYTSDEGSGTHSSVTIRTGPDGQLLDDQGIVTETGLTGTGPAIETLPGFEPDETSDLDAEDEEGRLTETDPTENRPITALVTSNLAVADGGCHLYRKAVTSVPWAETHAELVNLGELIIRESASFAVIFECLPWYFGDEGEKIHVTHPTISLDHDATVHKLQHSWPINDDPAGDRPIPRTKVTALIYPEDFAV